MDGDAGGSSSELLSVRSSGLARDVLYDLVDVSIRSLWLPLAYSQEMLVKKILILWLAVAAIASYAQAAPIHLERKVELIAPDSIVTDLNETLTVSAISEEGWEAVVEAKRTGQSLELTVSNGELLSARLNPPGRGHRGGKRRSTGLNDRTRRAKERAARNGGCPGGVCKKPGLFGI